MGKRTKLILALTIGTIVIGSGAVFALGKTGVIDLKTFADSVVKNTKQVVSPKSPTSSARIILNLPENIPAGTSIIIKNITTGNTYSQTLTDPGNNIFTGTYTFSNIAPGHYEGDESKCVRVYPFNVSADNVGGHSTGEILSNCTPVTNPPTGDQTKYCVRGKITSSVNGSVLQGARAAIGSNSGVTDSFGNYQITGLAFANLASDMIRFSKDGFVTTLPQNVTNLNSSIHAGTCDNTLSTVALVPSAAPLADTFSEFGTIKDRNGNLLGDVTIKISCLNSDQATGVSCGDGTTTWQGKSISTLISYPGLPANKTFNAEVPNISRYSTYTRFPSLRLTFEKAGYFWDTNGDGIDNDTGSYSSIPRPSTIYTINGNRIYVSLFGEEVMIQKAAATVYSVKGTVKDAATNANLAGVSVNGGNLTDASGNYEIKDLPISSAAAQTFVFHKDGYADQTKTLQQLGISLASVTRGAASQYSASHVSMQAIPVSKKVDVIGTVGFSLPGVTYQSEINFKLTDPRGNVFSSTSSNDDTCSEFPNDYRGQSCNFRFQNLDLFDGNYKLEILYDQSKYYLISGVAVINLNLSQGLQTYVFDQNHYFARQDYQIRLNDANLDKFSFATEILYNGQPIDGIKLQVKQNELNFIETTTSALNNIWSPDTDGQKISNAVVKEIPKQNEFNYFAQILPTVINNQSYILDPSEEFYAFNASDLVLDQSSGTYYYFKTLNLVSTEVRDYKIQFFDSKYGSNIDLSKENISRNDLLCSMPNNQQNNCVKSKDLWNDPNNPNNSVMRYTLSSEIATHSLNLYFETDNYIYSGGGLAPSGVGYAYLLRKNDKSESLACRNIDGVDFCTYKAIEAEEFKSNQIAAYKRYAAIIKAMAAATNVVQLPDVFLIGKEYRAFARDDNNINAGELDSQHIFSLSNMDVLTRGEFVVVHEFGHIVDFNSGLNKKYFADFENALKAGRGLKSDGTPIVDSSGQPIKSCNNIFQGYQCFSNYAITTNSYELWAEFFTWRVLHSDQVDKLINSTEMKKPGNEHCRKTIMFLDELMRSQFPKMKTFQTSRAQSNIQNVDDKFASRGLLQNIIGQNANAAGSDSEFLRIMSEAGYYPASVRSYDTVSRLSDLTLKAEDIAAGTWLKSSYDTLPPLEKTRLQLNIAFTRANNIVNVATAAAQTTLSNLNNQITNILIRLGFRVTNTLISGVVKDQDGPAKGLRISFGSKTAFTDDAGKYSITKIPTGSFNFILTDPSTSKTYVTSPIGTTMADNQQRKNMNLKINRPIHRIKGQIYQNNNPLNKGQMIIDGNRTVNLNAKGEFNFQLKEGQYKIIIRNKNGKTLKISNSGAFGNLGKYNNVKDIDSMIWVQ